MTTTTINENAPRVDSTIRFWYNGSERIVRVVKTFPAYWHCIQLNLKDEAFKNFSTNKLESSWEYVKHTDMMRG